jgi:hypothetical protein
MHAIEDWMGATFTGSFYCISPMYFEEEQLKASYTGGGVAVQLLSCLTLCPHLKWLWWEREALSKAIELVICMQAT